MSENLRPELSVKREIETCFAKGKSTSSMSVEELPRIKLTPNITLSKAIRDKRLSTDQSQGVGTKKVD
jgi:hypothetical protein